MKKLLSALFIIVNSQLSTVNFARADTTGWYISSSFSMMMDAQSSARVGGEWHTQNNRIQAFDNLSYIITLGYEFEGGIRLEIDVLSTTLHDSNASPSALNYDVGAGAVRLLYDIDIGRRVNPYIGGAIRGINLDPNFDYDFGLILGFSFKVSNMVSVDFEYQRSWYRQTGAMDVMGMGLMPDVRLENGIHQFRLATRTRF